MSIVPRAALDDPVGYSLQTKRTWAWARTALIAELGSRGKIDAKQAHGYAVGLKALTEFLKRVDPEPRAPEPGDGQERPINIAIILATSNGHADAGLQAGSLQLHLGRGDGER